MTLPLHGFPDWQTSLRTADLQTDVINQNLNAGAQVVSTVFDMRAYNSYSLMASATVNTTPPTAFGNLYMNVQWWANSIGTQIVYEEDYSWFPETPTAPFATDEGRVFLQDAVHGPWISITLSNNGVDQLSVAYRLLGNSRTLARRYINNASVTGTHTELRNAGQLASINTGLAAGASTYRIVPIAPGPISMRQQAVAAPMVMQFLAPDGTSVQGWNLAAGTELHSNAYLPRVGCRAVVVNTGGVASAAVWEISSGRDNW